MESSDSALDVGAATVGKGVSKPARARKKRGYHHGDLRNSIIAAVADLIAEQRSANIQLRDVAARVGTSQPAIYKHFDGKQALLVEVAVAGYELQTQLRDDALKQARPSPLYRLLAIALAYVRFSQTYPGYFLLMKNFETDEMLSAPRYRAQLENSLNVFRSNVTEAIEEGLLVDVGLELTMATLQTAASGLAHLLIAGQMPFVAPSISDRPELPLEVLRLVFAGLLTPKGQNLFDEAGTDPFVALSAKPTEPATGEEE
ncbi:TetR/AcrR family transcriptional regulator [Alteriqipengyuania lutimaris]|uniref:TetR/AcrR family transcriptional regulator n=1 Tax=Alteriqipengyuania lutimaris TaxID=1538146 RepID=A0A395LHB4_9SPHN|nr:TetR/AcrR family transcriptional regulator [Alteriqipengyuania lutimaris]MBB3034861.1 AcrR family transcriptional regulator [Alteriqipengyuania lutimaris]RDS76306.1 TetR/AcrR family transcriptional regulator [Alteriqipengyuania lutimaris]